MRVLNGVLLSPPLAHRAKVDDKLKSHDQQFEKLQGAVTTLGNTVSELSVTVDSNVESVKVL